MTIFQVRKNFDAQSDKFYTAKAFAKLPELNCENLLIGCSHEFGGDYYLTAETESIKFAIDYILSNAKERGDNWCIECYTDIAGMPETTFDITLINVNE